MIEGTSKGPTWKETKRMRGILTAYQHAATDATEVYWTTPYDSKDKPAIMDRMTDLDSACSMIRTGLCSSLAFPSLGSAVEQIVKHARHSTASCAAWLVLVSQHVRELAEDPGMSLRTPFFEVPTMPVGSDTIRPSGDEDDSGPYCDRLSRQRHAAVESDGLTWEQACARFPEELPPVLATRNSLTIGGVELEEYRAAPEGDGEISKEEISFVLAL